MELIKKIIVKTFIVSKRIKRCKEDKTEVIVNIKK